MVVRGGLDRRHDDLPRAGAVELGEKDALPGAQDERASLDGDREGRADETASHVRGRVPLAVMVFRVPPRDHFLQPSQDVAGDVGIGVLVDEKAARRVKDEEMNGALLDSEEAHSLGDLVGDGNEGLMGRRWDRDSD